MDQILSPPLGEYDNSRDAARGAADMMAILTTD